MRTNEGRGRTWRVRQELIAAAGTPNPANAGKIVSTKRSVLCSSDDQAACQPRPWAQARNADPIPLHSMPSAANARHPSRVAGDGWMTRKECTRATVTGDVHSTSSMTRELARIRVLSNKAAWRGAASRREESPGRTATPRECRRIRQESSRVSDCDKQESAVNRGAPH